MLVSVLGSRALCIATKLWRKHPVLVRNDGEYLKRVSGVVRARLWHCSLPAAPWRRNAYRAVGPFTI